jgi:hypothetical protein
MDHVERTGVVKTYMLPAGFGALVGASLLFGLQQLGVKTVAGSAGAAEVTADDLDKEQLSQLHNATLKASDSCFELKKLCATVLVPTATLVAVFASQKLNAAVFWAGLLVIGAFWLADSVGYYYQRRLRMAMTPIWQRRAARCAGGYSYAPNPLPVGPLKAAFNSSMLFYLILAVVVVIGYALFELGVIA